MAVKRFLERSNQFQAFSRLFESTADKTLLQAEREEVLAKVCAGLSEVCKMLAEAKEIRINGKILTMVRSRKTYKCCACGLPIELKEEHYAITQGGGGLGSLKFPDRIHSNCVNNYFGKGDRHDH